MKNNKGITLMSLIAYIILAITIISMLTVISIHFRNNLNNMDQKTVQDIEFDKLNLQILKEIKTEDNLINEDETTSTKLVFTNSNTYTYVNADKAIYLNDNVKISDNISSLNFQVTKIDDIQKLVVTAKIADKTRTKEYIITGIGCNHNYGEWQTTTAATCVATGTQTRTCSLCGEEETQTIPATGEHTYGNWTTTTAATCVASGTQIRTCSICGNEETQTIDATGVHSYTSHSATLCTRNQTYCPTCGGQWNLGVCGTYVKDSSSSTGDKFSSYYFWCQSCSTSHEPTSSNYGYFYRCSNCSAIGGYSVKFNCGNWLGNYQDVELYPEHTLYCSDCSYANQLFYTSTCSTHSRSGKHYYCNTHGYTGTSTSHSYCSVCGVNG